MTHPTRVRALILTTQRTGSSFLVECLGCHPEIECASEILEGQPDVPKPPYRGSFQKAVKLANIIQSGAWRPGHRMSDFFAGGRLKVRAFKAMYNQLARPFVLRYLREHEEVRIIHLRRQNLLKCHVSVMLMPERRRLQVRTPVEPIWICIDPAEAIANMRMARERYERFEKVFERHPRLPVTYENLIDGQFLQRDTGRRICEFLDVALLPMKSRLMKVNPESLREMVTNYDELAEAVSRTEFANMLE